MIDFGLVKGKTQPPEVQMTDKMVFVAANIQPYSETIDDLTISGYQYDYKAYTKDEYIQLLTQQNTDAISNLEEELKAAKILLGVE